MGPSRTIFVRTVPIHGEIPEIWEFIIIAVALGSVRFSSERHPNGLSTSAHIAAWCPGLRDPLASPR